MPNIPRMTMGKRDFVAYLCLLSSIICTVGSTATLVDSQSLVEIVANLHVRETASFSRHHRRHLEASSRALQATTCETLLDYTYTSAYERSNSPCTCTSSGSNLTVACDNYDYCQECEQGLCATQSNVIVFDSSTAITGSPLTQEICIEFDQEGTKTNVCYLESRTGSRPQDFACELTFAGFSCNTCRPTDCGDGNYGIEFDCDNILDTTSGLEQRCGTKDDTSSSVGGALTVFGPDLFTFASCIENPNPTVPPTLPATTTTPTQYPTTTTPTLAPSIAPVVTTQQSPTARPALVPPPTDVPESKTLTDAPAVMTTPSNAPLTDTKATSGGTVASLVAVVPIIWWMATLR